MPKFTPNHIVIVLGGNAYALDVTYPRDRALNAYARGHVGAGLLHAPVGTDGRVDALADPLAWTEIDDLSLEGTEVNDELSLARTLLYLAHAAQGKPATRDEAVDLMLRGDVALTGADKIARKANQRAAEHCLVRPGDVYEWTETLSTGRKRSRRMKVHRITAHSDRWNLYGIAMLAGGEGVASVSASIPFSQQDKQQEGACA